MANRRTMPRPDIFDVLPGDPDHGLDAAEEARRNVPTVDLEGWDNPPPPMERPPEGMGDGMDDLFASVAQRYGSTPEKVRALYEADEGMFYNLVAKSDQEAAERVPATEVIGREKELPKAIGATGTEWHQVYIAAEEAAQWTGMYPPLDPPDARGRRWQPRAVKVQLQYVKLKRDLEGFTFGPKGPFHPPGWLPCELPNATGGRCEYKAYGDGNPADLPDATDDERRDMRLKAEFAIEEHQAAKHPRMYRAKQSAMTRRSSDGLTATVDGLAATIAQLQAQGARADENAAAVAEALRLLAQALPGLARPADTEG